jgi:hypothetical protein
MLDWLKRRGSTAYPRREARPASPVSSDAAKPHGRVMSGTYLLLYKYLENRYADTVVLTFAEIEDLLGFELPDQARLHREWWTATDVNAGSNYSDSWVLASRTAVPNLMARTVVFERAS